MLDSHTPTPLEGKYDKIDMWGSSVLALDADHKLYVWGRGVEGQLGVPECQISTPTHVELSHLISEVAAGGTHSLLLSTNGTILGSGDNTSG